MCRPSKMLAGALLLCCVFALAASQSGEPPKDPVIMTKEGSVYIGIRPGQKVKIAPLTAAGVVNISQAVDVVTSEDLAMAMTELKEYADKAAANAAADKISNDDLAQSLLTVDANIGKKLDITDKYTDIDAQAAVDAMITTSTSELAKAFANKANKNDAIKTSEVYDIVETMVAPAAVDNDLKELLDEYNTRLDTLEDGSNNPCGKHCSAGEYVSSFCNEAQGTPTTCASCEGEKYSIGGLQTECKSCRTCDTSLQYEAMPCTATGNRQCAACKTCTAGAEYETGPCNGIDDRTCTACDTCVAGSTYETRSCTLSSNRVCTACTVCASDELEETPCTLDTDTVCRKSFGFRAVVSGGTLVKSVGWTTVSENWNTARSGQDTLFDTGHFKNGVFTSPIEGYYAVAAQVRLDSVSTTGSRMIITINDGTTTQAGLHTIQRDLTNTYYSMSVSGTVFLKKGDNLRVKVFIKDESYTIQSQCGFSVINLRLTEGFSADKDGDLAFKAAGWTDAIGGWRTSAEPGLFNIGSGFDATTGVYTVQEDGIFLVNALGRFDNSINTDTFHRFHATIDGNVDVNNGMSSIRGQTTDIYFTMGFSSAVKMTKGQTIDLRSESRTDADYKMHSQSYFSIVRITAPVTEGYMAEMGSNLGANSGWTLLKNLEVSTAPEFLIGSGTFTGGSTYTVNEPGYYFCGCNARFDGIGASRFTRLSMTREQDDNNHQNTGIHSIRGNPPSNYFTMNVAGAMDLEAGDKIEVQVYSRDTDPYAIQSQTTSYCVLLTT